jgi:predicted O-methyltransferase YrrM
MMNLKQVCKAIADYLGHDGNELFAYAQSDNIGGWNGKEENSEWSCGSVWGVEGQLLHAIVRAEKPEQLVEIGNFMGCSTAHIAEALMMNGSGILESFDLYPTATISERHKQRVRSFTHDLFKYNYDRNPPIDFIFLDDYHSKESTAYVFQAFAQYAAPGSVIIVHDSEHEVAGPVVKEGIEKVVPRGDYLSIAISPALCGLAVWRKHD